MQKRGLVIALVLGVLFISLSFASAFSFSDFFKEFYGKITGKVIDNSAIPSGLVGHWTGDGNALDSSGNGINGVWTGTESYNTGKFGQAFKFDGSTNYIKTSFNNAVNIRDSLTISFAFFMMLFAMASFISLVLPPLPFEMTLTFIIPSISNS